MLSAGFDHWDLYLGATQSGLARDGQAPLWQAHADIREGLEACSRHVRPLTSRWRRPEIHLWLSGQFVKPFLIDRPVGMLGAAEAWAWAQKQAENQLAHEGAAALWLDEEPPAGAPQLGIAMAGALRNELLRSATTLGLRIRRLRPWFAKAQSDALQTLPSAQLLVALDTDTVTFIAADGERWLAAESSPIPPNPELLEAQIARKRFSYGTNVADIARVGLEARPDGSEDAVAVPSHVWPSGRHLVKFD